MHHALCATRPTVSRTQSLTPTLEDILLEQPCLQRGPGLCALASAQDAEHHCARAGSDLTHSLPHSSTATATASTTATTTTTARVYGREDVCHYLGILDATAEDLVLLVFMVIGGGLREVHSSE